MIYYETRFEYLGDCVYCGIALYRNSMGKLTCDHKKGEIDCLHSLIDEIEAIEQSDNEQG